MSAEPDDLDRLLAQAEREWLAAKRRAQADAIRWAADAAFPAARRDCASRFGAHWIALNRWADRVESGEVEVPS